jgi:hypothetical protein
MSARARGAALALAALLFTAGCARSGPPSSPAAPPSPAPPSVAPPLLLRAGQCYERPLQSTIMTPVLTDCAKDHQVEIAYVAPLDFGSADPPEPGSPGLAPADAECRAKTAAYLGGPVGRRGVTYEMVLPGAADWDSRPHWFACAAVEVDAAPGRNQLMSVQGSLAAAGTAVAPRCFVLQDPDAMRDMTGVDCAQPHSVEFAGAVSAPLGSPLPKNGDDPAWQPLQAACRDEIAAQMGVPAKTVDQNWGYNLFPVPALSPGGVSVAQCYFVLWNLKTITGSILGSKGRNIPKG